MSEQDWQTLIARVKKLSPDEAIKRYAKVQAEMSKKFTPNSQTTSEFLPLGSAQKFERTPQGLHITTENGLLVVEYVTPHVLMVRARRDRKLPRAFSYALDEQFTPQSVDFEVAEKQNVVDLLGGELSCSIARPNTQLTFLVGSQIVCADALNGMGWLGESVKWRRYLSKEETCHALGQRAFGLNLRGQKLALWNADQVGYQRGTDPVYYSIPFYFGLHPQYTIGILWDNPARGMVDLGHSQADEMSFNAETGELRFYLIAHDDPQVVLQQYMTLTGRPPMPPMWAFGNHQSRWGYQPSDKFRELAYEFRQRQIPCDVLHFDIDYMDGYRLFTRNPNGFNDLPQVLEGLSAQGFKSIGIVDPAIKLDDDYPVFLDGVTQGVFHQYPDGSLFSAPVWAGESAFPDFTNPQTRTWWSNWIARFLQEVPFAGLWNDMNEPTVFLPDGVAGSLPDYLPGFGESYSLTQQAGGHNVYGMQMARATRDGLVKAYPQKRPFTLTRAAYAGAQRYTASWTGDNAATWDHLRLSVSMVLNLNLSGMYFTGPDIGGFFEAPTPELYARWIQLGSMMPFCRTHSAIDTPSQEPWSFGPEVETIARNYLNLRYQLLPYFYSTYIQCIQKGLPFIRPLFLHDRYDKRLATQDDAFLVGDSLLVAPVLAEGVTEKRFYMPGGIWFDLWTRQKIIGGQEISVPAPLDRMPLFVRAGATLPLWPVQQFVGERPRDELHLMAFVGNGQTVYYEDSGEGIAYQSGAYHWSYFTNTSLPNGHHSFAWQRTGQTLPYQRIRLEVVGISNEPDEVLIDGTLAPLWYFDRGTVEVVGGFFDEVRIVVNPAKAETLMNRPTSLRFD